MRRKIELLAKVILEEMNKPSQEQNKKSEDAPEDSQDDSDNPLDVISISVERKGGKIEVELKRGDKTIERAEASPRRGDFEGAMRKITNALSDYLKLSK